MKAARVLAAVALATLATWAPSAAAWDSLCYSYQDPTVAVAQLQPIASSRNCEGVDAPRGRYRDPMFNVDEHRVIFQRAAAQAVLPLGLLETQTMPVLTSADVVNGKSTLLLTFDPVQLANAKRAVTRAFSIDELAELPDFSFSLWDWARGNEVCPLAQPPVNLPAAYADPQSCHTLQVHMGATNANHFPPQSDAWFDYYHGLATDRANQCRTTRAAVWDAQPTAAEKGGADARFFASFLACEVEALAYEAVAQHFLQDSWSAGHMWQRWGSADITAVPDTLAQDATPADAAVDMAWNAADPSVRRLVLAQMVAVQAGLIHGTDPVVFELSGEYLSGNYLTLHDPMCYPESNMWAVDAQTKKRIQVTGDLHLHDVVGGPPTHAMISSFALPSGVDYSATRARGSSTARPARWARCTPSSRIPRASGIRRSGTRTRRRRSTGAGATRPR